MFALVSSQDHQEPQLVTYLPQSGENSPSFHFNAGDDSQGHDQLQVSPINTLATESTVLTDSVEGGQSWPSPDMIDRHSRSLSSGYPDSVDSTLFDVTHEALTTNGLDGVHVQPSSSTMASGRQGSSTKTTSTKPRKRRRPKPRIELAPDQPPTTQGKPRSRVYVACLQCRTRKIRCDGAKPICYNCKRRDTMECEYDALPKRRGPDKTPGARQRIVQPSDNTRRRRRLVQADGDGTQDRGPSGSEPESISPPLQPSLHRNSFVQQCIPASEYADNCNCHGNVHCPTSGTSIEAYPLFQDLTMLQPSHHDNLALLDAGRNYLVDLLEEDDEPQPAMAVSISNEPSLHFTRKVWWDSLLCLYLSPNATRVQNLTASQREMASRSIVSDLRFVFQASNYWFSFFHIPTFMGEFNDPGRRERMQPCLVLSLLAMATFWKSSEVEFGKQGRERALRFRDEAQAALEASINSRWISESVVQAAWVLAMFEVSAHPHHSSQRALSALTLLDSLVHSLSLTLIDVNDPETPSFPPRSVPSMPEKIIYDSHQVLSNSMDSPDHFTRYVSETQGTGCRCRALTLATNWPQANEYAPLWGHSPAWHPTWSPGEIRKESCRRLCWSSMSLAAGYIAYMVANWAKPPDLFIANPASYALLFSGEAMARSSGLPSGSTRDTIWALYDRSYLLWHSCARMRYDQSVFDTEKAQFAVKAWLEADALETALGKHSCNLERASLYQAQEYIFNTRMCISYEYQRWIPLVTANVSNLFHRKKAEEWLSHQASVARRLMDGMHTVTGTAGNTLARRPFFVFWFMGQINRAMSLWEYDNSLLAALDVCKAFITAVDYLTSLWPSAEQRMLYENLRQKVDNACQMVGVSRPPPLDFKSLLSKPVDSFV